MTNEDKAKELGIKYETPCHGVGDCEFEAYQAAIEMAQWKDEQFAKEKQALVDRAVLLLQMIFVQQDVPVERRKEYIEDFKQTLEKMK